MDLRMELVLLSTIGYLLSVIHVSRYLQYCVISNFHFSRYSATHYSDHFTFRDVKRFHVIFTMLSRVCSTQLSGKWETPLKIPFPFLSLIHVVKMLEKYHKMFVKIKAFISEKPIFFLNTKSINAVQHSEE